MPYPQYEITLSGNNGDEIRTVDGSHTGGMRILSTNAVLTVEHHAPDDEFPQIKIKLTTLGV